MKDVYVVMDGNRGIDVEEHAADAAEKAAFYARRDGDKQWVWDAPEPGQRSPIKSNPPLGPETAFRASGLPLVTYDDVLACTQKRAHEALVSEIEEVISVTGAGKIWLKQGYAMAPGRGMLRPNFKTEKGGHGQKLVSLGLSLVPEYSTFSGVAANGNVMPLPALKGLGKTFCAGSSAECRQGCLVYTGKNQLVVQNVAIKQAIAKLLVRHPVEFTFLLIGALDRYLKSRKYSEYQKFVRLNMLADVPFEIMYPDGWLFDLFPELSFYDYTKVPGRQSRSNYDLSFSYSGENWRFLRDELHAGHRAVVAFIPWAYKRPKGVRKDEYPFPKFFNPKELGISKPIPVIDGDSHDIRPLDPDWCCVGLRWKKSKGLGNAQGIKKFVVRGHVVENADGREFIIGAETGPSSGAEAVS